eukprot:scaffold9445_cov78-Skeletonema_dohrnii-CCMP3373.AAC.3
MLAEDVMKDYCSGSYRESIRSLSTRLADEELKGIDGVHRRLRYDYNMVAEHGDMLQSMVTCPTKHFSQQSLLARSSGGY